MSRRLKNPSAPASLSFRTSSAARIALSASATKPRAFTSGKKFDRDFDRFGECPQVAVVDADGDFLSVLRGRDFGQFGAVVDLDNRAHAELIRAGGERADFFAPVARRR